MFLNLPQLNVMHNQINMINIIYNHQQADRSLVQTQQQDPAQMLTQTINRMTIISIALDPQQPTLWKIYLPQSLLNDLVEQCHFNLSYHTGVQRMYNTISSRFCAPRLYATCNRFWRLSNYKKWK